MAFNFDSSKIDALFRDIILGDEGAFPYASLRKHIVKNPDTLAISEEFSILQSGTANWNHPQEKISYETDGVRRDVTGIVFIPTPSDIQKTDVIYNTQTDNAFRVMGMVNYSSHVELHVEEFSLGTNFTLPELPTSDSYLSADVVVI